MISTQIKKKIFILFFYLAGKILGYPIKDINDGNATGFSHVQLTVDEGKRMSSAKAYLNSKIIARKNLDVVLNAMVTKVLIRAKTAYGVNFVRLSGYFFFSKNKKIKALFFFFENVIKNCLSKSIR